MEPTNKDIVDLLKNHMDADDVRFVSIEKKIDSRPSDDEIEAIVVNALKVYFEKKGTSLKTILIGTAIIIGAITVIFGGIKAILGWLGFSYLGK